MRRRVQAPWRAQPWWGEGEGGWRSRGKSRAASGSAVHNFWRTAGTRAARPLHPRPRAAPPLPLPLAWCMSRSAPDCESPTLPTTTSFTRFLSSHGSLRSGAGCRASAAAQAQRRTHKRHRRRRSRCARELRRRGRALPRSRCRHVDCLCVAALASACLPIAPHTLLHPQSCVPASSPMRPWRAGPRAAICAPMCASPCPTPAPVKRVRRGVGAEDADALRGGAC
jgi:hypothetical protein